MGCWNHTCAISSMPIMAGQPVMVIPAQKVGSSLTPFALPFKGEYNDYGFIEGDEWTKHPQWAIIFDSLLETARKNKIKKIKNAYKLDVYHQWKDLKKESYDYKTGSYIKKDIPLDELLIHVSTIRDRMKWRKEYSSGELKPLFKNDVNMRTLKCYDLSRVIFKHEDREIIGSIEWLLVHKDVYNFIVDVGKKQIAKRSKDKYSSEYYKDFYNPKFYKSYDEEEIKQYMILSTVRNSHSMAILTENCIGTDYLTTICKELYFLPVFKGQESTYKDAYYDLVHFTLGLIVLRMQLQDPAGIGSQQSISKEMPKYFDFCAKFARNMVKEERQRSME